MSLVPPALFRLPDFRWLSATMVLNSAGMMGELVVLGWLSLELTNSPFLVGVAMGARAAPLFFVGVPAGVLADQLPRRRLLIATNVGQAATAALIGLLAVSGVATFGHLVAVTLAAGVLRGIEHAARQSYTHDVVGAANLVRALALQGAAMRTGWLFGSLGTGAVIAHWSAGIAYLCVAASYLAGAVTLLPASTPAGTSPPAPGSLWDNLVAFGAALRRDSTLPALMLLTAAAEVLGFAHQTVLPSLARDILHIGPDGLGALNAARAVGGIVGLFAVSARRPGANGSGVLFFVVLVSFGASLIALGFAPRYIGFAGVLVVLVVVNAIGALADLLAQSLMQLSVPSGLRGRAGGAWVAAIGLAPVGQLQIGALASLFGVAVALGASGLALAVLASAAALLFPKIRRL